MKHLKIKNKVRFTFSMFIIFAIFLFVISSITSRVFSCQEIKYSQITISYGDTLWNIAKELEGNIHENIYNIQKINNLDNCNIYEGQHILIPVK